MVEDAVPFTGKYPSSVMDRTLLTPAFNKAMGYHTVNLVDDADPRNLAPTRLEFDTHSDGEMTLNDVPASSPLVLSRSDVDTVKPTPPRRHRRGFFNCFRPSNDSPE